jgi:glycosyltransferase involved in cell wall biosynthesis
MNLVIGTPVYNEAEGIEEFLKQIDTLAGKLKQRWPDLTVSSLLMDDGSRDSTVEKIKSFTARSLDQVEVACLSRNFGPYPAISAIFHHVDADAIIIMDADLQDSPDVVPKLVQFWRDGYESVRVIRGRRAEGWVHSILSRFFYMIFGKLSGLNTQIGTFGLYSRKVIDTFRMYPEKVRYFPGLISLIGFKTQFITTDREARFQGTSRVGFRKLTQFALYAIVSFSSIPIHVITVLGIVTAFFSASAVVIIIATRIFTNYAISGWASILSAQFFLGGLIIFSLGIIGQYIGIIFNEVKARPEFVISHSHKREFKTGI